MLLKSEMQTALLLLLLLLPVLQVPGCDLFLLISRRLPCSSWLASTIASGEALCKTVLAMMFETGSRKPKPKPASWTRGISEVGSRSHADL